MLLNQAGRTTDVAALFSCPRFRKRVRTSNPATDWHCNAGNEEDGFLPSPAPPETRSLRKGSIFQKNRMPIPAAAAAHK